MAENVVFIKEEPDFEESKPDSVIQPCSEEAKLQSSDAWPEVKIEHLYPLQAEEQDNEMLVELPEEETERICDDLPAAEGRLQDTNMDPISQLLEESKVWLPTKKRKVLHKIKTVRLSAKKYLCTHCNKGFNFPSGLQRHSRTHAKKIYNCLPCRVKFARGEDLEAHMSTHTEGNPRLGEAMVSEHIVEASLDDPMTDSHEALDAEGNEDEVKQGPDLERLPLVKLENNASIDTEEAENQADGLPKKQHTCSLCQKSFASPSALQRHRLVHTKEKPFSCSVCEKAFSGYEYLRVHERSHTEGKPFACSSCDKSFFSSTQLKFHIMIHTGEKPYACSSCDMTFYRPDQLKLHSRTHTGEKPFSCSMCGLSFNQKRGLAVHMRSHTGEKPYVCSECDKAFASLNTLAGHKKTHRGERPFSCSFCDKAFTRKEFLAQHERAHTGERPYACKYCPKTFALPYSLRLHHRTHTGEKPHTCSLCSQSFLQLGGLKKHMRRKHDPLATL